MKGNVKGRRMIRKLMLSKRRHVVVILMAMGLAAGLFLSCAAPAPAPAPAPKPAPLKLSLAHAYGAGYIQTILAEKWARTVEERSRGQVKIEIYPAGQLVKHDESFDALARGAIQISLIPADYFGGKEPILDWNGAPGMVSSWDQLQKAWVGGLKDIMGKAFAKHNIRLLDASPSDFQTIYSKKQILLPKDCVGLKMRTHSKILAQIVEALGATPVIISSGELYMALERGTVDATIFVPQPLVDRSLYEVVKYGLDMALAAPGLASLSMSTDGFQALPKDLQDLFMSTADEILFKEGTAVQRKATGEALQFMRDKGMIIHKPTPEEWSVWQKALSPVLNRWIETVPGAREVAALFEKYK